MVLVCNSVKFRTWPHDWMPPLHQTIVVGEAEVGIEVGDLLVHVVESVHEVAAEDDDNDEFKTVNTHDYDSSSI